MTFRSCFLFAGLLVLSLACQSNTKANPEPVTKQSKAVEPIEAHPGKVNTGPAPVASQPAAPTAADQPEVVKIDKPDPPKSVKVKAEVAEIEPKETVVVSEPVIENQNQEIKAAAKAAITEVVEVPEVAQPIEEIPQESMEIVADHATWDALLQKYVSSAGHVDYKGFKAVEAKLDSYLELLSTSKPTAGTARNEAMSYWLNAYNAFTIKLILKNYPVASIQDIGGGKPWDLKWIKLGDGVFSLNQIENEIIRPTFKDPRIHFAVNCAAKSCPPLYNKAFVSGQLEQQLEQLTKAFVNNTAFNQLSGGLRVSKIFEWYGTDFGDIKAYLNKYAKAPITGQLAFAEYDWALNGK